VNRSAGRARGDVVQAAPGRLGQHGGEGEPEDRGARSEQEGAAQPEGGLEDREQEDADERSELAEIPWPVVRILTGYSSLGSTNVVMLGLSRCRWL
jgi:hypothetical protein